MASGGAAELAVLFPAPRTVVIAGRSIELKRCGIGQAGRIIDVGLPLYGRVQAGEEFLDLFETSPAETTALIVAATDLPTEWVAALDPVDQFALASEWMEVNAAFFVQRLLPSLARYMGAIGAANGAGPTFSPTSTTTATPAPLTTPRKPPGRMLNPSRAPKGASGALA